MRTVTTELVVSIRAKRNGHYSPGVSTTLPKGAEEAPVWILDSYLEPGNIPSPSTTMQLLVLIIQLT